VTLVEKIIRQMCSVSAVIICEPTLREILGGNGSHSSWEESSLSSNISSAITDQHYDYNRLSNTDSGFMSVQSYTSYSKRSSQQSSVSSQWASHQQHMSKQSSTEATKTESVVHNVHKDNDAHLTIKNFNQKSSSSSSSSSLVSAIVSAGQHMSISEVDSVVDDSLPPAIPQKTRRKQERQPSPYDNVPDSNLGKQARHKIFELILIVGNNNMTHLMEKR
jgi:hypothetical protein